ncbi:MAG: stage IV sporulation protein A [Firmicutes bacterium HGW-Firmicutes-7]|nr:MAG: stage IV sporulation protein A [Firmicutes bacterium HGW-Firmicutes-7]
MFEEYDVYSDIKARTNGEIYIGVVGPVRTGKSTFIKRFMDLFVIPNIDNVHMKERAKDELPQSSAGKTIMTTEPKFIPQEAARISLGEDIEFDIRLIDCVGYMVDGASGHLEQDMPRMVKTPWFNHEIPFTEAAEIGTKKVINDHSTIGIVVTTDGSFGEIPGDHYVKAEEKTVAELKKIGKPFVLILNTIRPFSDVTSDLVNELEKKYGVTTIPCNCEQLRKEDVEKIFENVLFEFPVSSLNFNVPKWIEVLDNDHWLKESLIGTARDTIRNINTIRDIKKPAMLAFVNEYVDKINLDKISLSDGSASMDIKIKDDYYYNVLSDLIGSEVEGEYQFISLIKKLGKVKKKYEQVEKALADVSLHGYGIVSPHIEDLVLDEPEIVKQGNRFGVKLKASAPTIHMIKCDIETEVSPIVGTEKQSEDFMNYIMSEFENDPKTIWNSNIFGRSLHELVNDGLQNKIYRMPVDTQLKLQETLKKIMNEGNGGLICIII